MRYALKFLAAAALVGCSAAGPRSVAPFVPSSATVVRVSESSTAGDYALFILPPALTPQKFIQFVREETRRGGWVQVRRALTNPVETNSLYAGWIGGMWEGTWRRPNQVLDVIIVPANEERSPGVPEAKVANAMEVHIVVVPQSHAEKAFASYGERF